LSRVKLCSLISSSIGEFYYHARIEMHRTTHRVSTFYDGTSTHAPGVTKPVHRRRRNPRPDPFTTIDAVDPAFRPLAGTCVQAAGASCGASLGLGICCVVPFSAGIGTAQAAEAVGLAANPDVVMGAAVGAAASSFVTAAAFGLVPGTGGGFRPGGLLLQAGLVGVATVTGAGLGALIVGLVEQ
jgi:hypothetical protein